MLPLQSHCDLHAQVGVKDSHIYARLPTRSGLAVYKNVPALVALSLYEGYRRDQMLEDVGLLNIVQRNLLPDEGLETLNVSIRIRRRTGRTSGMENLPLMTDRML